VEAIVAPARYVGSEIGPRHDPEKVGRREEERKRGLVMVLARVVLGSVSMDSKVAEAVRYDGAVDCRASRVSGDRRRCRYL